MIKPPIGIRNNNPLNIKWSANNNWRGQKGCNEGFVVFTEQKYCFRAARRIISKYISRGVDTMMEIIAVWSPDGEKIVNNYVNYVSSHSHIPKNKILSANDHDMIIMLYWMAKFECGGYPIDIEVVERGYMMA